MIRKIFQNYFHQQEYYQTFTYYIPAPPERKSGYREKEFDRVLYTLLAQGHQLVSSQTIPHQGPKGSGFWIICVLKTTNPQSIDISYPEKLGDGPIEDELAIEL